MVIGLSLEPSRIICTAYDTFGMNYIVVAEFIDMQGDYLPENNSKCFQ